MSRELPPAVRDIAQYLSAEAGTYLYNVIREPRVTCAVCFAPVEGYTLCWPCRQQSQSGFPLADRVGSMVYAVEYDSQAYRLVQTYKTPGAGPSHETTMQALLALGLRGHYPCAAKLSGASTHGWAVVPSTRGRTKLRELVISLTKGGQREVQVDYAGPKGNRELRPDYWTIRNDQTIPEHVVVIDDSWVTGAHAQSVAASIKLAGADQVSIFTVARVLSSAWEPNPEFIRQRLRGSFDANVCPWTGGDCP